MSDKTTMNGEPAICEKCGKSGPRRVMRVSPDGWYFGMFKFDSEGDHDPGDMLVVHACSIECRDALFTPGTGQSWDDVEARVDFRSEMRRSCQRQAKALRAEAARIRRGATQESVGASFAKVLDDAAAAILRAADEADQVNERTKTE